MNSTASESKVYFNNLDGLRIILALIVFAAHSMFGAFLNQVINLDPLKRLVSLFSNGGFAVSFFFVLSGFLITYLMMEEKNRKGKFSVRNFYVRRILRIWPLYFSVLIFSFFLYPLIKEWIGYPDKNPFRLFYQVFFLANFDTIHVQQNNLTSVAPMMIGINWSVSIEEQFYLVWPLLFVIIPSNKFWILGLVLVGASWAFRFFVLQDGYSYYHTFSVISDLVVGAMGAWMCFYRTSWLAKFKEVSGALSLFLYFAGTAMLMYSDFIFKGFFFETIARIFHAIFFCFIILDQSFSMHSKFKIGKWKRLSGWGKYSYGFYMLHPIGIQVAIIIFKWMSWRLNQSFYFSMLYVLISLFGAATLAVLSYHLFERYFLNLRKFFYE